MSDWQLIETAPKDGSSILVRDPEGRMLAAWWCGERWWMVMQDGEPVEVWQPTHWMPLPEPPE